MNAHELEDRKIEKGAFDIFSKHYQNETGSKLKLVDQPKPPKPDLECLLDGTSIDIEVGHVFGTDVDAQRIMDRPRREPFEEKELLENRLIPLGHKFISQLNTIISRKSKKHYESSRVWLLIRIAHPIWNREDILNYQDKILIPEETCFEQIWIVCDPRVYTGIMKLK